MSTNLVVIVFVTLPMLLIALAVIGKIDGLRTEIRALRRQIEKGPTQ